ncbi:MAG: hypothetical protein M3Q47_01280 [Actinomycetota bacterium]|nr:hypothetical protein [Actinomycetota bacterium]
MRLADTWHEPGARAERRAAARPEVPDHVARIGRPPVPPLPPRMRSTDLPPLPEAMARSARDRHDRPQPPRPSGERAARPARDVGRSRPVFPEADRPPVRGEHAARDRSPQLDGPFDDQDDRRRGARSPEPRSVSRRPALPGATAQVPGTDSRLRGSVAVLAVFLVTLAGAALESWISTGLGLVTLLVLTAASAVATLVVRRRDLLTPVVAPPLVYVLVAVLNTALAPSASLNVPSIATMLVRGFPAMAVATAAAGVVALIRSAARP